MNELFRAIALSIQKQFNDFDNAIARVDDAIVDETLRPLFMVAPPRTGTTLLYQYLLQNVALSYISNLMAVMPCHMIKLCRLFPRVANHYTGPIRPSYHGFVPGLLAPSEAGKIVDRWFDAQYWPEDRPKIRRTIAAISLATGRPLLLKSLTNSTRIDRIMQTFPYARFIVVTRDERFAAQSILLARQRLGIGDKTWWSVCPPGVEHLDGKSAAYRAVWQVVATNHAIRDALTEAGRAVKYVRYEQFCDDPSGTTSHLAEQFGLLMTLRPESRTAFTSANRIQVDSTTWDEIETAVQQLTNG